MNILGIMNGTSIDAVDYALIKTDKLFKKVDFLGHRQCPIPKALQNSLLKCAKNEMTTYEVSQLNFDLGKLYASQLSKLPSTWKWTAIGVHGQSVHHQGRTCTLQIGHPSFLSQKSKCPVIYDFRSTDIAAGGEGAPFAPFFQKFLGTQMRKKTYAFHNLGGISNLGFFNKNKIVAFDTGPANILIDIWMKLHTKKNYDKGGKVSEAGLPDPKIVERFIKNSYFSKTPPKSTGRELFNSDYIFKTGGESFKKLSFEDQMSTLTEVTAITLAMAYQNFCKPMPTEIYFYGGGVFNSYLMSRIQYHLPKCKIKITDEIGWPSQAFEASLIGFLAAAKILNKKVHLPQVTGAKTIQSLGSLYS